MNEKIRYSTQKALILDYLFGLAETKPVLRELTYFVEICYNERVQTSRL